MSNEHAYVILAAIDFSEHATRALGEARRVALRTEGAELHVVHVVAPPVGAIAALGSTEMAAAFTDTLDRTRKDLEKACNDLSKGLSDRVYGHIRTGRPAREIAEVATQIGADLVVVGTHGRSGLSRALLGSVAEEVVRHSPCNVLAVRIPAQVPAIEPACEECLRAQGATGNRKARCEAHTRRHPRPHTYTDGREGLFHQSFRFD